MKGLHLVRKTTPAGHVLYLRSRVVTDWVSDRQKATCMTTRTAQRQAAYHHDNTEGFGGSVVAIPAESAK